MTNQIDTSSQSQPVVTLKGAIGFGRGFCTGLRKVFWDWSTLTLGAGGTALLAFESVRDGNIRAALGFGAASAYAAMTFGEGCLGAYWKGRADAWRALVESASEPQGAERSEAPGGPQ